MPIELKFSPKSQTTTLDNKVQILSEYYNGSYTTVSVGIKMGSRYEDVKSSGCANFLTHLITLGSQNKSKTDFTK